MKKMIMLAITISLLVGCETYEIHHHYYGEMSMSLADISSVTT